MRLESIKINNIRSIKNLDLEFPQSTMLFFGDIGSGKSSVLKSIEFALFGVLKSSDLDSSSLLRRGERNATVELAFSVGEKDYVIHRELKLVTKNGKSTISQPKGWFIEDGNKVSYTTTELKRKILKILNYSIVRYENKPSIDLFRYTVYTPQEEIKKVLQADPSERFEILKDVLEIEKYENTLDNLENIRKQLGRDIRIIGVRISEIGEPKNMIPGKEQEIEEHEKLIKDQQKNIEEKKDVLERSKKEQNAIQEELTTFSIKITQIESMQKIIDEKTKSFEVNTDKISKLRSEISKERDKADLLPKIELMTQREESEIESEIKVFREELKKITAQNGRIHGKIDNIDKLLKEGKCSLCGQTVHEIDRFNNELKEAKKSLTELDEKNRQLSEKITQDEQLLKNFSDYKNNDNKRKSILDSINGKKDYEKDLVDTNTCLEQEIKNERENIERILKEYGIKSIDELQMEKESIKGKLNEKKILVDQSQSEFTSLVGKLSSLKTELKNLKIQLDDLQALLKYKDQLNRKHQFLNSVKDWVSNQFPVLLKDIERSILFNTASLFNAYFKEWFRILVEDENIDIEINPENFQPIVRINGYESPFEDMSGGEKSALSLAYRLALNMVINTKYQDVKTKDLLILDEPTDGFSEEQVNRMQEVFSRLKVKQMIIISHERTLDSFVQDILTFKKSNHKTSIKREKSIT